MAKFTTLQKIVSFLILTVGIVYIVFWINQYMFYVNEGFISPSTPCADQLMMVGGRNTFMCKSAEDARTLLTTMQTQTGGKFTVPICYTENTDPNLNMSNLKNSVYVCYDFNGDPEFNTATGVYTPFDPITDNDPMPGNALQDSILNYTSLVSGYNSFDVAYKNISTSENYISTNGYAHAFNVRSTIIELSNLKCRGAIAQSYPTICEALTRSYNNVNGYLTDTAPSSLRGINTLMTTSKNTIKNQLYQEFLPGFYDSHVMTPSIMSNFLSNR